MSDEKGQWAIVELFGHKAVAGYVTGDVQMSEAMLRIDVPATSGYPAFTQFYGVKAIYCMTPVSEEVARRTAERNQTNPVSIYVPELISRQQHEKVVSDLRDQMERRLRNALPGGIRDRSDDELREDELDEDDRDD